MLCSGLAKVHISCDKSFLLETKLCRGAGRQNADERDTRSSRSLRGRTTCRGCRCGWAQNETKQTRGHNAKQTGGAKQLVATFTGFIPEN